MFKPFLEKLDGVLLEAKKSSHVRSEEMELIFKKINDYIEKNKLILSNPYLLAGIEENPIKTYVLYGSDIFIHANNIANEIAKITIHVFLFTNVKNQDFTIKVNGMDIVQLYNISKKLKNLVLPIEKNNLLLYPPEFDLMEIYYKLYSPLFSKDWPELENIKNIIEAQFISRKEILGGLIVKKEKKFDNSIIFNWLKNRTDYIIIGINAIELLNDSRNYNKKVQIITSTNIDVIVKEIKSYIFQSTGLYINVNTNNLLVPFDLRLNKSTISIKLDNNRIYVLDIFNNAQYDLVPFTTYNGFQLGYPNVLKMFLLIDIRFSRVMHILNVINSTQLNKSISILFDYLTRINKLDNKKFIEEYLGVISDYSKYKKKLGLGNIYFPYSPEQYRYQNGEYRKI